MSYTTPYIGTDKREHGKDNLQKATADLMRAFFSQKYEDTLYLPDQLRLGKKTFEAAKKLFLYKTLWFDDIWKTKYLLGDRSDYSSHEFWGILSKIWPRQRAKVISDLFIKIRPKLRAIIFLELIRLGEDHQLYSSYFNFYLTSGWRCKAKEIILRNRIPILRFLKLDTAIDTILKCAGHLCHEAFRELREVNKVKNPKEALDLFFRSYNKLHFASLWNGKVVEKSIKTWSLKLENYQSVSEFLESRTILRAMQLVGNKSWLEDKWVKQLLNDAADIKQGRLFAAYCSLYYANTLNIDSLPYILNPVSLSQIWDRQALNSVVNETVDNLGEEWYSTNPYHRAINMLRLVVYLRCHPMPKLIIMMPSLIIRINNIARHLIKNEKSRPFHQRVVSISNGPEVLAWAYRLLDFCNSGNW